MRPLEGSTEPNGTERGKDGGGMVWCGRVEGVLVRGADDNATSNDTHGERARVAGALALERRWASLSLNKHLFSRNQNTHL